MVKDLESIVLEYEKKTGISRVDIFRCLDKKNNDIVWISEVLETISKGFLFLGKKDTKLSNSQQLTVSKHLREIADIRNCSKEDVIKIVCESICWKANKSKKDKRESKYFTKDFFTRKNKNNFKNLIYFYEDWISNRPFSKKKFSLTVESKKDAENREKNVIRFGKDKPNVDNNESFVSQDELDMF